MGRTVLPGNCALMGATRLASGKMQCSYTKQKLTDSTNYTPICESLATSTFTVVPQSKIMLKQLRIITTF
jgi:hypothetical protein